MPAILKARVFHNLAQKIPRNGILPLLLIVSMTSFVIIA